LDTPRVVTGMARQIAEDLAWLGIAFDASPERGGPHAPYTQGVRGPLYDQALRILHDAGHLFPCNRSRKNLRNLASAPHGASQTAPYPVHLRPAQLDPGWFTNVKGMSIRFRVADRTVAFEDKLYGLQKENVSKSVGDFVLRRRDGLFAYQLAVVVDDIEMGITEVVRGADLLDSTARQILLIEALGGAPPVYGHVPLMVAENGLKLSKRDQGLTLLALREAGIRADTLVGYLAYSLGLKPTPDPRKPGELIDTFAWDRIRNVSPWRLPGDLVSALRAL